MSRAPRLGALFLGVVFGANLAGCASSTKIQVDSISRTNGGEPVYMMVRSGDDLLEPYNDAAKRVFTKEPDPKILDRQVIIPGTTFTVSLEIPEEEDLALYFFFTEYNKKNSKEFRLVVSRTQLPAEVQVLLGVSDIADYVVRDR